MKSRGFCWLVALAVLAAPALARTTITTAGQSTTTLAPKPAEPPPAPIARAAPRAHEVPSYPVDGWGPAPMRPDHGKSREPVHRTVLHDRLNFPGISIGITRDTPNLASHDLLGRAVALRVQGGVWLVCTQPDYLGRCEMVTAVIDLNAAARRERIGHSPARPRAGSQRSTAADVRGGLSHRSRATN